MASVPGTWGATTRAMCSLECSMKLTRLDVLSIAAVLLLGQNHYYTGSNWSLAAMGAVLVAWTWLSD